MLGMELLLAPLLKSALWALTGPILHYSITRPYGNASERDNRLDEGLFMKILIHHGMTILKYSKWTLTLVEILTIQSSSFRKITSYPNSADASTIGAPFLATMTILLLSFILRMYSYHTLGNLFTFEVAIRPHHNLITDGPYRFVRHPSYTALYGVFVGNGLLHLVISGSWAVECGIVPRSWNILWLWVPMQYVGSSMLWKRIKNEEEMLQRSFGAEWESYKKRVPYRVLPGIL